MLVVLVAWVQLIVYASGDLFATSDFANYIELYQSGALREAWGRESLFYQSGSVLGALIGYWNYHLLVIHLALLMYFGIIRRVKSDVVFLVAAMFPVTFVGFDIFFSAIRSTLATLMFVYLYRFAPSVILLYLVHFGVFLQSLISLLITKRRLIVFGLLSVLGIALLFEHILSLYEIYYLKFANYEGEGALEGVYNLVFVAFFVANWVAFESRNPALRRFSGVLFLVYGVAAAVGLPYAYRLSYFPILLQQCNLGSFRFGPREFVVYAVLVIAYVGLTAVRIT